MKCVSSRLYNDVPRPHPYEHCPLSLVDHVLSHVMSSDESDWPDSQQAIVALLKHYQTQLEDHQQATTLEQLGLGQYCTCDIVHINRLVPGINIQRFFDDVVYKRDKILLLSRLATVWL